MSELRQYLEFEYDTNAWPCLEIVNGTCLKLEPEHISRIDNATTIKDINGFFLNRILEILIRNDSVKLRYNPDDGKMDVFACYEYAFFDYDHGLILVPVVGEDLLILLKALALDPEYGEFAYMVYKARKQPVFDIQEYLRLAGWDHERLWHAAVSDIPITDCFKGKV